MTIPDVTIRSFQVGDGPAIADGWTAAAPADPISYQRFRDLFLLDRNFDAAGLQVAVIDDQIVGAAYAVRRLIAVDADDLEPAAGWIPFFFVHPEYRRRGIGRELMLRALAVAPRGRLFFGAQSQSVGFFEKLGCEPGPSGMVMRSAAPAWPPRSET